MGKYNIMLSETRFCIILRIKNKNEFLRIKNDFLKINKVLSEYCLMFRGTVLDFTGKQWHPCESVHLN